MQQERLRSIADSILSADVYRWQDVSDPWAPVKRVWGLAVSSIERLREQNPAAYRILFWSLVVVLLVIVAHTIWVAMQTMYGGAARTLDGVTPARTTVRDAMWYRREADRLAAAGKYAEAIQLDFVRLMLDFDARKLTAFHPSKTPGEYVREARIQPAQRGALRGLVNVMYAHVYAGVRADAQSWALWRERASTEHYAVAH